MPLTGRDLGAEEGDAIALDAALRPLDFSDFAGQQKIRERLEILVGAAQSRGDVLPHLLFSGPPGLGKTTLAGILARAMGARLRVTSGPVLERAGDLAGILTGLEPGDVLFIDEIHRLNKVIEEYLYPAMEDFRLDIIIDQGPNARSISLNLPRFTLIGATTRAGMLSSPLRSRFGMVNRLDYYDAATLAAIVKRSAGLLNLDIADAAAHEIARRSRGTPRIANNLLRWVRDYAAVHTGGRVDLDTAIKALAILDIDGDGLDEMDKRILEAILNRFQGGPVGLGSLAVAVGEEPGTIEEVYEPYLIMEGFLARTAQGRVAGARAYHKFGLRPPATQPELI
jgi:Holliday junction DNA helicase RuvB